MKGISRMSVVIRCNSIGELVMTLILTDVLKVVRQKELTNCNMLYKHVHVHL